MYALSTMGLSIIDMQHLIDNNSCFSMIAEKIAIK